MKKLLIITAVLAAVLLTTGAAIAATYYVGQIEDHAEKQSEELADRYADLKAKELEKHEKDLQKLTDKEKKRITDETNAYLESRVEAESGQYKADEEKAIKDAANNAIDTLKEQVDNMIEDDKNE